MRHIGGRGAWAVALAGAVVSTLMVLAPTSGYAGSAVIGGVKMNCAAAEVIVSNEVPGPGFAVDGAILFSPKHLSAYPPVVQRLVFLHECAHQYVGADERAADCWAVKAAKRQGWLSISGLRQACRAIWHTEADGYHVDGPQRCQQLLQCFETAPGGKKTASGFKGKKKKKTNN